jgi:hypothetical protein
MGCSGPPTPGLVADSGAARFPAESEAAETVDQLTC